MDFASREVVREKDRKNWKLQPCMNATRTEVVWEVNGCILLTVFTQKVFCYNNVRSQGCVTPILYEVKHFIIPTLPTAALNLVLAF